MAEQDRITVSLGISRKAYALVADNAFEGVEFLDVREAERGAEMGFGLESAVSVVVISVGITHLVKMFLEIRKLLKERAPNEEVIIYTPDGKGFCIHADSDCKKLERVASKFFTPKS